MKITTRGRRKALTIGKLHTRNPIRMRAKLGKFRASSRMRLRKGTEFLHATKGQPVAIYFNSRGEAFEFRGELVADKSGLWTEGYTDGWYHEDFLPLKKIRFWYYENEIPWGFSAENEDWEDDE